MIHFPHSKVKNLKKVHRLVILPDYQGLGLGLRLLTEVGKLYKKAGFRYAITTSSPSLVFSLKTRSEWRCRHKGKARPLPSVGYRQGSSIDRLTVGFELKETSHAS